MATMNGKARCLICDKEKSAVRCEGCLNTFCFDHLKDHRHSFNKEFGELEQNHDIVRQRLTEQIENASQHPLLEQIDRWEDQSIKKIQQTAEEAKQVILKQINRQNSRIEFQVNTLTEQLRKTRQENDFNESDLVELKKALDHLSTELGKCLDVFIREDPAPLITKIYVEVPAPSRSTSISASATWTQNATIVAGGDGTNQLYGPYGIFVDDNQTVYVADRDKHRIVEWTCGAENGQIVAGGNRKGDRNDQLNQATDVIVDKENNTLIICDLLNRRVVQWSRQNGNSGQTIISDVDCWGLAMDNEGYLYVSDGKKHEVRRWRIGDRKGIVVAGGNGQGNRLDQLNTPTYLFVDDDHSVYVSDTNNHRVMKWIKGAAEGIVVAGGHGQGNDLTQLSCPHGVIVDQLGTVYVADSFNERLMRWPKGATQGSIVVGENRQEDVPQLHYPVGLAFDRPGNLYVTDFDNRRVQKYNIDLRPTA